MGHLSWLRSFHSGQFKEILVHFDAFNLIALEVGINLPESSIDIHYPELIDPPDAE